MPICRILHASRLSPWVAVALLFSGCAEHKPQPPTENLVGQSPPASSSSNASAVEPNDALRAIDVGDDPAASLPALTEAVRAAIDGHRRLEKLIYPRGWYRFGPQALEVSAKLTSAPDESPSTCAVEFLLQDRNTLIHPTAAAAEADQEFLPRTPAPTRDEMLSDRANPALKPVPVTIEYQAVDGRWRRTLWQSAAKNRKGADWLDRIGAP